MNLSKCLIATLIAAPAVATVVAAFTFRACSNDAPSLVIVDKKHSPAVRSPAPPHAMLSERWYVVASDGEHRFIITCSKAAWESVRVGDEAELIEVNSPDGVMVRRLRNDDEFIPPPPYESP